MREGSRTTDRRALMAIFDRGHRLALPNGYWVQKNDDNRWQIGYERMFLAFHLSGNVPVGPGGSMDHEVQRFVEAMQNAT